MDFGARASVQEWDDGSSLMREVRKLEAEREVLALLEQAWRLVALGTLLVPFAVLPIFPFTGTAFSAAALLAGLITTLSVVCGGVKSALAHDRAEQEARVARQLERVHDQLAILDRLLEP